MKPGATALMAAVLATGLSACAPYEAEPVSVYQWERKLKEAERQEAERQRLCQALDKQSARYQRDCAGVKA
ncbi:hypothetical protein [Brevundimonas vesicularis]|uniref:hypothetical protein n=1 Tax=Brevundimonas vesicularis TaxID=41276 RepID=UPI0038D3B221